MKLGKVVAVAAVVTTLNVVPFQDANAWTTWGWGGVSYSTYGNTSYGSDGSMWSTYGNTTYGGWGSRMVALLAQHTAIPFIVIK